MRLKILNMYSLTPHHTDPVPILFYASYLCRLTYPSPSKATKLTIHSIPLTFNFTTLLARPPDPQTLSTFSSFLGSSINLTPLGEAFNAWFPLFILLPVILTLFNLYDKIKKVLGLGDLGGWIIDDEEDEDRGEIASVVEGREILKRELGVSGATGLVGGGGQGTFAAAREGGRVLGGSSEDRRTTRYTDDDDHDDEEEGENFFVATGHRLWNSISSRVDDLRGNSTNVRADDEEGGPERGFLRRIGRPRWMKRGDSGVSVWRLPRWGRGEDEGRVVL
jgi:LMBR1-like membrane protein